MYSRRSNLVLGFHGLDESIGKRIIAGEAELLPSENDDSQLENWNMTLDKIINDS